MLTGRLPAADFEPAGHVANIRLGAFIDMNPNSSTKDGVAPSQSSITESEPQRSVPEARRDQSFLLGFYPEQEARQFLLAKGIDQDKLTEILNRWSRANALIKTLPPLSSEPEILPILEPDALLEINSVMDRPEYKQYSRMARGRPA